MNDNLQKELLELTQQLLDAVSAGDWQTYETLCDPTLSAFEPEARGHLVEGMAFHRFYFERGDDAATPYAPATIAAPHVRLLGPDAAVVSYIRLMQSYDADGRPQTTRHEETRVWQRQGDRWRHVHFHRSANP